VLGATEEGVSLAASRVQAERRRSRERGVQREITKWPVGIYADFLRLIFLMEEHGADLRLPHSRAMGDGLFELRRKGEEGIGRVFYCTLVGRQIVILHSFIKKTQETPGRELKTARKRLKEVKHG